MEIINILYLIAGVIFLLSLIILLLRQLQFQWKGFKWQRLNKPRGKLSRSYFTDPRNRQLQRELLKLLRGEVDTAERLLQQQRRLHPGKSDRWYLEKVIYDLKRDRR